MFGAIFGTIVIRIMEPEKKPEQAASENALEEPTSLNALESLSVGEHDDVKLAPGEEEKKTKAPKGGNSKLRKLRGFFNVYLLIFVLIVIIVGAIFIVAWIQNQKEPPTPVTALQELTQQELNEIAAGDATVGDPRYVLNIQSDAVFAGNALVRGNLSVAGAIQLGQGLTAPSLTVPGTSNLTDVQIDTLSVAGNTVQQGNLTAQGQLTVGGASNFGGPMTATQLTVGSLTLGGSGALTINNHIVANGPTPSRSQGGAVGVGGSTSNTGSDTAGSVTINTGHSTTPGCFITINFTQNFNGVPHVVVTPVGAAGGQTNYYVNRTNSNFSICTANAAPTGQNFGFDYIVIN